MNIHVFVNMLPFCAMNAQEYMAGLYGNCMFNFKRNCQTVFQGDYIILHFHQQCMHDSVSLRLR